MYRKPKKQNIRYIDFIFFNEAKIRSAVKEARLITVSEGGSGYASCGSKHSISDPTAKKALKNLGELESVLLPNNDVIALPERWLFVIEKTYTALGDKAKCIRLFYAGNSYIKICMNNHISAGTLSNYKKEARQTALAIACQLGLIDAV